MTQIATDERFVELTSQLSVAFSIFAIEAVKLTALLERPRVPVSHEDYAKLEQQGMAEVQAFEEYLNRKEEIFAYLKMESRKP